jgi:glycosyltransferase involved in cell wall biosynthesis
MSLPKIFALIAFRDEEQHLPGMFSHLRDYVDGFVAFNDCSSDRSAEIARAEPKMIHLLQRHVPSADHQFEIENRKALLAAAHENGAQWVLCCDADERYETRFLEGLRGIVQTPPAPVLGLRLVAVWENFTQHRVGKARKFVLFPSTNPQPYYPSGILHQQWYPPRLAAGPQVTLDYYIYHLGSITRADRMARYEKFNRIDPDRRQQPQGYENIIDETDLVLAPITPERAFRYE